MIPWLYANRRSTSSPATQFNFALAIGTATAEFKWAPPETLGGEPRLTEEFRSELEYLLASFFEAQCFEWSFLFSVLLCDTSATFRVLDEVAADKHMPGGTFVLLKRFGKAVATEAGAPHKPYFDKIATTFRSATPLPTTDIERERNPSTVEQAQAKGSSAAECLVM